MQQHKLRHKRQPRATAQIRSMQGNGGREVASQQPVKFAQQAAGSLAALYMAVCGGLLAPLPAEALLSSPNAQIARSSDAALRRAIPASNTDVRTIQTKLEGIQFKLRIPQRKPWGSITDDVNTALALAKQTDRLLLGVPPGLEEEGRHYSADIAEGLRRLQGQVANKDPDKVSFRTADVLRDVSQLELLQAPGLPYIIPRDYASYPRLTGRAVVEFIFEKGDASYAFVSNAGGGPQQQARLELTLDGYSAPLTAGNFAVNVQDDLYVGKRLDATYGSVLAGRGLSGKVIPLELLPAGEFDLVYRSPLEPRSGELPVLPLSISGAVAMAHSQVAAATSDGYVAADQFFIMKFDKQQAGLAGLAFDEGKFGVFGYITSGMELLPQLQSGDIIVSTKILSGADRLVKP